MGLSQVPEGRRIFPAMSVLENLELGAFLRNDKSEIKKDMEMVFGRFPILGDRRKTNSGNLIRRRAADAGYGKGAHVQTKNSLNG